MKEVKCPLCHRIKEVKDNVIMTICPGCQCEMLVIKSYKEVKK